VDVAEEMGGEGRAATSSMSSAGGYLERRDILDEAARYFWILEGLLAEH
jgi:hypothetical protein